MFEIGSKFGYLTVTRLITTMHNTTQYEVECICGKTLIFRKSRLIEYKSCGCKRVKHGHTDTRLYYIWQGMKRRCYSTKNKDYKDYGGRGIGICPEWMNSASFVEWALNNGYTKELSIDRINNDLDYSPGNCRWATISEQINNRRNTVFVEYKGERLSVSDFSKKYGLDRNVICRRILAGHTVEEAMNKPIRKQKNNKKR